MKNHGFSLIEVMVVVTIIGILLAITHLNFAEMQRKENVKADLGKITSQIRLAQLTNITQSKTSIIALGDNKFTVFSDSTDVLPDPQMIGFYPSGKPAPNVTPTLTVVEESLRSQTIGYQVYYVSRQGYVYGLNPEQPIVLSLGTSTISINGNQILQGGTL